MSTALTLNPAGTLTAADIKSHVQLIQEVMRAVMKDGTHYGKIPGCGDKPTLLKPGAEKILATFRIAVEPVVTDLSTADVAHYRVEARAISASGQYLGSGIGEASSLEAKYCWRGVVCQEEWDATPENRRRTLWKRGRDSAFAVQQVRTEAADIANTVLKMAKKRAQIDMTLTVTAASDCFQQDLEDMPEEILADREDAAPARPPIPEPRRSSAPVPSAPASAPAGGDTITEGQGKLLYARAMSAGHSRDTLSAALRAAGYAHSREIPKSAFNDLLARIEMGPGASAQSNDDIPF